MKSNVMNVLAAVFAIGATAAGPAGAQQVEGPGEPNSANGTSGGAIKATRSIAENAPTSIGETASHVLLSGPAAGSEARFSLSIDAGPVNDDWIVQFSGECRLFGSGGASDWVDVQIRFDGQLAQPFNGGTPVAFCSDNNYSTHAATAMVEHVPTGVHTVEVFWRAHDGGANNTLTARMDDWTFLVMVSE